MFAIKIKKTITYPEWPALTYNRSTAGALILADGQAQTQTKPKVRSSYLPCCARKLYARSRPRARRSLGTFQKPKSLFWAPPVYKDLSTRYDWPVKNATVDLSASQTESVRLKDRRQQRGNVHALFLLPCRLSVTRDHVFEDMRVTYQGKLFSFRSLPPARALRSFP